MQEKVAKCGRPLRGFDESFRTAMDFLSNPHELWASGRIEDRHAVMKLTFADRLEYIRGEGFRPPEATLPFKALGGIFGNENKMARPAGLEPATLGLEGRCSIQLSYGRVVLNQCSEAAVPRGNRPLLRSGAIDKTNCS